MLVSVSLGDEEGRGKIAHPSPHASPDGPSMIILSGREELTFVVP